MLNQSSAKKNQFKLNQWQRNEPNNKKSIKININLNGKSLNLLF
jgi:hypothetical protein